jgi:hypothetical protein
MIPAPAPIELGRFRVFHEGPFVAGMRTTVGFEYEVGPAGVAMGARFRVGLPNTGWEEPVPPQQRYWDELIQGTARRLAPFHPVNTTAAIDGREGAVAVLSVMERMLAPDEDPAIAYWRWWITATIEGAHLSAGDVVRITYGDRRFVGGGADDAAGAGGARVQTFVEDQINAVAFVQPRPEAALLQLRGSPWFFDVVAGPPVRANVVAPSTYTGSPVPVRISVTDRCHCRPAADATPVVLVADGHEVACVPGRAHEVQLATSHLHRLTVVDRATQEPWGVANPAVPVGPDGLRLFWGDLHAQSEHHVMHSQDKDFRQRGWSKGISCGTVDDSYAYAKEVALLDFIALTDQGACLTDAWEFCQGKVREHHEPGRFVTFKGYEAGAPNGHRNVIYASDAIEPPLDPKRFSSFEPRVLFDYYRERGDAILIPHHVKTWTDWNFHDPELEPLMEVYSCWGQSESPSLELWDKGMTPGAGAWGALRRGYRMGMIASSDNHVGMPGRSYPGDRQAHTPFKGGLCAIWAADLTRESLFNALKERRCYGTTGARIIVRFSIDDRPMGSAVELGGRPNIHAAVEVLGTGELKHVQVVTAGQTVRDLPINRGDDRLSASVELPAVPTGHYYLRVIQADGERAWTSPIFMDDARDGGSARRATPG